jgi:hypothetical protein
VQCIRRVGETEGSGWPTIQPPRPTQPAWGTFATRPGGALRIFASRLLRHDPRRGSQSQAASDEIQMVRAFGSTLCYSFYPSRCGASPSWHDPGISQSLMFDGYGLQSGWCQKQTPALAASQSPLETKHGCFHPPKHFTPPEAKHVANISAHQPRTPDFLVLVIFPGTPPSGRRVRFQCVASDLKHHPRSSSP